MTQDNSIHRLIYSSRQTPEVAADLDFVLGEIVRKSISNNRIDDLTGLLMTAQGVFLQVLEGPEEAVRRAYGRIVVDPRHRDLKLVSATPAERRMFGDWNMCARSMTPADKAILDVIDAKGAFDPARLTPAAGLNLLTSVAAIQRRTALTALSA